MVRRWLYTLIGVLALTCCATTQAQTLYKPHVTVGGKAGITYSKMTFSPTVKQNMTPGVIIGATFTYAEEKVFGLRGEILLEQRGWRENFEEKSDKFSYSRTLTYIQVPLLTTITFGPQRFKCVIALGPEVAYMIGNSISANFDYHNVEAVPDFPIVNRTNEQMWMPIHNKFDYGISGGLGVDWRLSRTHSVELAGRFYYGLGNIFPDHKKDVFNASRGMSIQLTAGYNFRLK